METAPGYKRRWLFGCDVTEGALNDLPLELSSFAVEQGWREGGGLRSSKLLNGSAKSDQNMGSLDTSSMAINAVDASMG